MSSQPYRSAFHVAASGDAREPTDREAALDEALAQTFPASDPIACTPKSLAELRMLGRLST